MARKVDKRAVVRSWQSLGLLIFRFVRPSLIRSILILAACLGMVGFACASSWRPMVQYAPALAPTQTPPPDQASSISMTAIAPPNADPGAPGIWLPDMLPEQLRQSFTAPAGLRIGTDEASSPYHVDVLIPGPGVDLNGSIEWIYALVAPFPTIPDGVTLGDLLRLWRSQPTPGLEAQGVRVTGLLVDESTRAVLARVWGEPGNTVQVLPADQVIDRAWAANGKSWAVVPFEDLEPRWKVIGLDGQSPIQKSFDPDSYGLTLHFGLVGVPSALPALPDQALSPATNRDPARLTTVVLTGVTALVRATASYMEKLGMTYPEKFIGDFLREADILHINNEVPFARDCPAPLPWEGLVFCSQTRYIELLDDIGTDVVELAGDHFADWGPDAMLYTLDLYRQRGWQIYGGGADITEAAQPALFEHNGSKIAFIGCNAKPPGYATASDTSPGAIHCDFEQMEASIKNVREEGYLPIVTFQHLEYYAYTANPILVEDFTRMARAGAVIVSGSQAHQPHAMAFENDASRQVAFIHYGLGNLFFDQLDEGTPTRQAFIDRHVFYNGRYISTELISIWFVDYAVSRPMKPDERADLLKTVFRASGW